MGYYSVSNWGTTKHERVEIQSKTMDDVVLIFFLNFNLRLMFIKNPDYKQIFSHNHHMKY